MRCCRAVTQWLKAALLDNLQVHVGRRRDRWDRGGERRRDWRDGGGGAHGAGCTALVAKLVAVGVLGAALCAKGHRASGAAAGASIHRTKRRTYENGHVTSTLFLWCSRLSGTML